jgi:hypothetical protein
MSLKHLPNPRQRFAKRLGPPLEKSHSHHFCHHSVFRKHHVHLECLDASLILELNLIYKEEEGGLSHLFRLPFGMNSHVYNSTLNSTVTYLSRDIDSIAYHVSQFHCHCDQIPDRHNLKEEGFILLVVSKVSVLHSVEGVSKQRSSQHGSQEAEQSSDRKGPR